MQIKRGPEADSDAVSRYPFILLSLTSASFPASFLYLHSEKAIVHCWVSSMPEHVCQTNLAGCGLRLGLLLKFKHIRKSLAN